MSTELDFKSNLSDVCPSQPNMEKSGYAQVVQQPGVQPQNPQPSKIDMGRVHITEGNLRNDYAGQPPKGDMNYACSTLANQMKETVDSVLGVFSPSDSQPEEPAMVAPKPQPHLAFGM